MLRRAEIAVILRSHMDDAPLTEPLADPLLHTSVYEDLRARFITGKIVPGVGLSTRGLPAELAVSQMPVRDALPSMPAEGPATIRSKRKIKSPPMSKAPTTDRL